MSSGLALLFVYVGGALGVSFLCSLLEAALLSIRESSLEAKAMQGHTSAERLLVIKHEGLEDAISAILTLNTIAHTIGATLAGAQVAILFGDAWLGLFSAVLTVLVLVVTEIIPKTIGATYAEHLIGFVESSIRLLVVLLSPILFVTRWITRFFTSRERPTISRLEISAMVGMATRQGTIQVEHQRLFDRVLALDKVRVCDVMTPRSVTAMLPASMTLSEFGHANSERAFSRIPIYGDCRDEVVGYVVQRQVLAAMVAGKCMQAPLSAYASRAWVVSDNASINNTLNDFVSRHEHLAVVVDKSGRCVGVVTLEDVVETILGVEIVDETDPAVNMRALAAQLRDNRVQKQETAGEQSHRSRQ